MADTLVITAGAGMGCDSGLPAFRTPDGFWKEYPALGNLGLNFADIATPDSFRTDARLAWGFYGHRLNLYRNTEPHEGFSILKTLAESKKDYVVVTSNVDGAFQKAGFDPAKIYEVHGTIYKLQCVKPCCQELWSAEEFTPVVEDCRLMNDLPLCPNCGKIARPNICMFGEDFWIETEHHSYRCASRAVNKLYNPIILEFGAGDSIPAIRWFGERHICDLPLIRVNPLPSSQAFGVIDVSMTALEFCRQFV